MIARLLAGFGGRACLQMRLDRVSACGRDAAGGMESSGVLYKRGTGDVVSFQG